MAKLRGQLLYDESLHKYTTWRVGGKAKYFYKPADIADLQCFLQQEMVANKAIFFLGLGSNVLIRDGGFDGVVISTRHVLKKITLLNASCIQAEAGVACAHLARFASKHHLTGLEFFAGIPGTVGGALAMNAGAFGSETWDYVQCVQMLRQDSVLQQRTPADFAVGYRTVSGYDKAKEWFMTADFILQAGHAEQGQANIKRLLQQRSHSQPTNRPTAGSVFRNPEGDYAARLIEACQLKNTCVGDACVAEKHANFIINQGNATAWDIEQLIVIMQQTVKAQFQITLRPEIRFIGEYARCKLEE